jgi:hypothetical protein
MLRLNLGCGQNLMEGYVNVDKYGSFSPDVVWDLEVTPWPFETGSVEEIHLRHVLEHLGAQTEVFLSIMKELYRVCAPNATVLVAIPHPRSDSFSGDPTHVRPINENIMSLFSKKKNREWKELGMPNTPLATYLDIDFEIESLNFSLMPHWNAKYGNGELSPEEIEFAMNTYFNVIDEITMNLRAIK